MTTGVQPYSYQGLEGVQAFRLLNLLPGHRDNPVRCTIQLSNLASRPEFYALSYCWGAPGDSEYIYFDGELLSIQRNLHDFLVELRLLDRPRTIWADAICINQKDVTERNAQVALMRDIYSAAQCVLVWLGNHDSGSAQLLQAFFDAIADNAAPAPTGELLIWEESTARAFDDLMKRPYWRRTWIIQEVVLAGNIRLFCGNTSIPWLDFVAIYQTCFQKLAERQLCQRQALVISHNPLTSYEPSDAVDALDTLVRLRKRDERPSLTDVMALNHPYECFDIRNRIFGVLGLVADGAALHKVVDYGCSTEALFFALLEYLGTHTSESPTRFSSLLRPLQMLVTRLNLDLVRCVESARVLQSTRSVFFGPFTETSHPHIKDVLWKSLRRLTLEFEVQLPQSSQTLRKYVWKTRSGTLSCMITPAKLPYADRLCLLRSSLPANDPPDFNVREYRPAGLYLIYRTNHSRFQDQIICYCFYFETADPADLYRYDGAVYAHFDDVPCFQDNRPNMQRPLCDFGGPGMVFWMSMSETLKIASFEAFASPPPAGEPTKGVEWRRVRIKKPKRSRKLFSNPLPPGTEKS